MELLGTQAPEAFAAAVAAARARARAAALALEAQTKQIVRTLAAQRIRALPLKGPPLAVAAHGDAGLRESGDVDVLVAAEALERAAEALVRHGYQPPSDPRRSDGLPHLHLRLRHPRFAAVELHWRVEWWGTRFSTDMLARAVPAQGGLLAPAPRDLAAALLLFYARDGFHGVRLTADLAGWWDRNAAALPPDFLAEYPRRYPELATALHAAAVVAERVSGIPCARWLGATPRLPRRARAAMRLVNPQSRGDRDQMRAEISLVGGLLGPPSTWAQFLRRELRLPDAGGRAAMAHPVKMLLRYGLAMWRIRRA
jgi:hypothetical protein